MIETFDVNSRIIRVKLRDSSVTTGAGLTGLTHESAGLIISTIADNEATATAYTQAGGTIETIATLGTYAAPTAGKCRFKEVDATNHPGLYEIQLADARLSVADAKELVVSISGAANLAEEDLRIQLTRLDLNDATPTVELADDAITADKFDETTAFPLTLPDTGVTAVARTGADSDTLETLSDQIDGVEPAGVWAYSSRTLTQAASTTSTAGTTNLTIVRGDTAQSTITGLGSLTGRTKLWFTVKSRTEDPDTKAVLFIEETDGLTRVNGAAYTTTGNGSITLGLETGTVIVAVAADVTKDLSPGVYQYDIQAKVSGVVITKAEGTFTVTADVTRAIA